MPVIEAEACGRRTMGSPKSSNSLESAHKKKPTNATINVRGTEIAVIHHEDDDFISLTDMVRNFDGGPALIEQWLKNKDTVLFLGVWEQLNNPDFKTLEFEGIKNEAGRNSFYLSAKKWMEATGARGLIAKAGRYGGTFAQRDIAFEFGSWLSPEFKLYLIKEFQRLKEDESRRLSLAWNSQPHVGQNQLPHPHRRDSDAPHSEGSHHKTGRFRLRQEADLLNVALGQTAREWRDANPGKDGNMRDHASLEQLLVLANLENMNAEFIHMGLPQGDRLKRLNQIAIRQMQTLTARTAKAIGRRRSVNIQKGGHSCPPKKTHGGLENQPSGSIRSRGVGDGQGVEGDSGEDWGMNDWKTCAVSDSFVKNGSVDNIKSQRRILLKPVVSRS